jgi:hypothetical protein
MNGVSEIFRFHPAGALGALVARPGQANCARKDAPPSAPRSSRKTTAAASEAAASQS